MSQSPKADIIIAMYPDRATTFDCVDRVLEHGGEHLGRLIVFNAHCTDSHFIERFERLADLNARIEFVRKPLRLTQSLRTIASSRNAKATLCF